MNTPAKVRIAARPPMAWASPSPHDFFARSHEEQWLAHVEAGRIGKRTLPSPEQLARHAHNQRVLLGLKGAD